MNLKKIRYMLCAAALVGGLHAQVVQFNATINAAQETPAPGTGSAATGSAIMLYDVAANTFDLMVSLNNFPATLLASHIHEAAGGVSGNVVSPLGAEASYTRNGNTLTATFRGLTYGGTKLTLLQNGAYVNFHTAAFPNGEIRGQLIAQPKRLYANIDVSQEKAAFPANVNLANANAYGAAVMTYDPGTNKLNLRVNLYNFTNTLTLSHYHEAAVGVSGPVVTGLGGASAYTVSGSMISGTFLNLTYTGDPVKLLTGGAYLNFHSNINPSGECRGQVWPSEEALTTRLFNLSTRGYVAPDQQLIAGLIVSGPQPVRVIVMSKGPSLAAAGLSGVLANPNLTLYDSTGRAIASNDDVGTIAAGSELSTIYGAPTNPLESALVVTLPPGAYTAIVTGNGGSGTAMIEIYDLRNAVTVAAGASGTVAEFKADLRRAAANPQLAARTPSKAELELCAGVPLGTTLAVVTPRR